MKVKALINYTDTELGRKVKKDEEFEVESEKRLKELLGDNEEKAVCVEVIKEETEETNVEAVEKTKGNKKNAKSK